MLNLHEIKSYSRNFVNSRLIFYLYTKSPVWISLYEIKLLNATFLLLKRTMANNILKWTNVWLIKIVSCNLFDQPYNQTQGKGI